MNVAVEDAGACRKLLRVEVPAGDVAGEFVSVAESLRAVARIPGFRGGKAPKEVVERRYAREIEEEVKDRAVPRFYRMALDQEKIAPLAIVRVSDVELGRDTGLRFQVTVDVAPDFKLPKYQKLPLQAAKVEVTDAQVEEQYRQWLDSRASYRDVTDRGVAMGDMVLIDYKGASGGQPLTALAPQLPALAAGANFWMLADDRGFVPGLVEGVLGAVPGETRRIAVRFPGDFHVAALADREAEYEVTVRGLRGKVLPEVDAALLKPLGVDSVDALHGRIREGLRAAATRQERAVLGEQAARYLLENTDLDLPQSVVDQEIRRTARDMVQRIVARGATRDQIEQHRDTIVDEATKTSRDRVKLGFILNRIAAEESLQVEEEELDRHLEAMARRADMTPAQFRSELEKRDALESLRGDLRAEKAMAFVIEHAKIKE